VMMEKRGQCVIPVTGKVWDFPFKVTCIMLKNVVKSNLEMS